MEIIVEGKGSNFFKPDEVEISITFNEKGSSYDLVLNLGSRNVLSFIEDILIPNGFSKDDLKTRNFVIREENKYNNATQTYTRDGYSFNQQAKLKFDYDVKKMSKLMEEISKLPNPPICRVNFGLKDEKKSRREILALAYKDAEDAARAIADASGLVLKKCIKVDFKPFETNYVSASEFNSGLERACYFGETAQILENSFTPEDIELTETLYCLWIAE